MDSIIPLIDNTILLLSSAEKAYEKVQNDNQLKVSFHSAGEGLVDVISALQSIKPLIGSANSGGDIEAAETSVRECQKKAKLSKRLFVHIAEAPPNKRLHGYMTYLALQDDDQMAEILVRGMMANVCDLAKQAGVAETIKSSLKKLAWAIEELDEEISKQKTNGKAGTVHHSGVGDLYSAKDAATQINNTGTGNQYNGTDKSH